MLVSFLLATKIIRPCCALAFVPDEEIGLARLFWILTLLVLIYGFSVTVVDFGEFCFETFNAAWIFPLCRAHGLQFMQVPQGSRWSVNARQVHASTSCFHRNVLSSLRLWWLLLSGARQWWCESAPRWLRVETMTRQRLSAVSKLMVRCCSWSGARKTNKTRCA